MKWHRGKNEIEILPTKTLKPHLHGIFKCMQMQNWYLKVFFFFFGCTVELFKFNFLFSLFFSKYQFIFHEYSAQACFYGTFIMISPLLHGQEHHELSKVLPVIFYGWKNSRLGQSSGRVNNGIIVSCGWIIPLNATFSAGTKQFFRALRDT